MVIHRAEAQDKADCEMGVKDEVNEAEVIEAEAVEAEIIEEKYLKGGADIPECRERTDLETEYRDFPEEKIWSPQEEVDEWVPFYLFMARSVLTFVQESQGVSNREAMENSCTGYAEQYVSDVLHDSEYLPEVALKTLLTKELPQKIISRWTPEEIELFVKGISKHGKAFSSIQKEMLPQKDVKDIVDFYYAWKWSDSAKEFRSCRRRRRSSPKRRFPSIACVHNQLSSKIVTRSVAAASRLSVESKTEEILGPVSPTKVTDKTRQNDSLELKNEEIFSPVCPTKSTKVTPKRRLNDSLESKHEEILSPVCPTKSTKVIAKRRRNSSLESKNKEIVSTVCPTKSTKVTVKRRRNGSLESKNEDIVSPVCPTKSTKVTAKRRQNGSLVVR